MNLLKSLTLAVAFAVGGSAQAQSVGALSEASFVSVLGGAALASIIVEAPFLLVSHLSEVVVNGGGRSATVRDPVTKKTAVISIPEDVAVRVQLKQGDRLDVVQRKSGGMLLKAGTPVIFILSPKNAALSKGSAQATSAGQPAVTVVPRSTQQP